MFSVKKIITCSRRSYLQRIVQFIGTSTLKANKSEVFATWELDATPEMEDSRFLLLSRFGRCKFSSTLIKLSRVFYTPLTHAKVAVQFVELKKNGSPPPSSTLSCFKLKEKKGKRGNTIVSCAEIRKENIL